MLAGGAWMSASTKHFERQTGRRFYGLAGNHYSIPEDGFEYQPNGEHIERWTVSIPPTATFAALLASAIGFTVALRSRGVWQIVLTWVYHAGAATVLALLTAWFWFNVMGVFI
jgi:hypothetical protein